jgi:hypothetical protein
MNKSIRAALACAWLCLLAACGGGGSQEENQPPRTAVVASGDVRADGAALELTLGGVVRLDASGSNDPDAQDLSYEWALTARPEGSTAVFAGANQAVLEWTPDALGAYTFSLTVKDSEGASASQVLTVNVNNRVPVSSLVVTPQFTVVPTTAATQTVTVGAVVLVDAAASADPDGDAVNVSFELSERPAGSSATLTIVGKTARLTADAMGLFKIRVLADDGKGGAFESIYPIQANNRVPNPVVAATATAVTADGGSNSVTASVGYDVVLDGGTSSDPDGQSLSHTWRLASKPVGSTVVLSSMSGVSTGFSPDVLGDYVVTLTVTDLAGAKSEYSTTVQVNNRRPLAQIGTNATPQALPNAPSVLLPSGTTLTLRGSISSDADGEALSYLWTLEAMPAGSTAALSSTTAADPTFTPVVEGSYQFRLRVTDDAGAFSERVITVEVGTHAPVALVDKNRVTVLAGSAVAMSGSLSYDEDGDSLTYQWSLDAKPAGSAATVTGTAASLAFTPDVAGVYVVALTVRDGGRSSVAYVTIKALEQVGTSVALNFVPGHGKYSRGLDKFVLTDSGVRALRIVDPFTGVTTSVPLPLDSRNLSLSPDGKLAVVLHESTISVVNLQTSTLIRSSATYGMHTDAFVTNQGIVFLIGGEGGQWVDEDVVTINGYTGEKIEQPSMHPGFYGTQYGVFADRLNKVFLVEQGLSPSDIDYFTFDPLTYQVTDAGDSPYHGTYSIGSPLFLSEAQDLVFTDAGDYFRSDSLRFAGTLSGLSWMRSMSHSAAAEELLALVWSTNYPSSYKRYTGALFLPDADLALPLIGGQQSYGIQIHHSANGAHVILAQTGSADPEAVGVQYHLVVR